MPDANATAISVTVASVTIDLNGFSIFGPCSGGPPCSPTGSGVGINAISVFGVTGVAVMNGTVRGMGGTGVALGFVSQVEKVRALSNGNGGIFMFDGTVSNCTAVENIGDGISLALGTVTNCTANSNVGAGIGFAGGGTVSNSTAHNNGVAGISAPGGTVTGCEAHSNPGGTVGQISAAGVTGHNICNGIACP